MLPGWFWLYDHSHYREGTHLQTLYYWLHWGMILLGAFFLVGATYGVVLEINDAYANGIIGMVCHGKCEDHLTNRVRRLCFFLRRQL